MILLSISQCQASASYSWENDIDVGIDGMSWTYTEQYTKDRSILFKAFIDSEIGDNDSFVAAWELLKMDSLSRRKLMDTLEGNMDVKINGSSESISAEQVASEISLESLGPVNRAGIIVNIYEVHYAFEEPLPSLGNRIWFLGEPGTNLTISLPESTRVVSTEEIDNVSVDMTGSGPQICGKFGFTGEAVVYLEIDGTSPEEKGDNENASVPVPESDERSFISLADKIFPGFTEDLLKTLKGSSIM